MIRRPPRSTRSDTPFPYSTLCRSRRTARIVALHRGDVLVPAGERRRVLVQHGLHPLEEHPVHVTHVAGIFEWRPHAGRGALRDVGAPEHLGPQLGVLPDQRGDRRGGRGARVEAAFGTPGVDDPGPVLGVRHDALCCTHAHIVTDGSKGTSPDLRTWRLCLTTPPVLRPSKISRTSQRSTTTRWTRRWPLSTSPHRTWPDRKSLVKGTRVEDRGD